MSTRTYPKLKRLPLNAQAHDAPTPPDDLVPEAFAARLYGMLAPLAQQDFDSAWSLLILCNAIGGMYEPVEEWVRDTPEGPGWSLLVDLDRCPPEALPWLGQFVGVRIPPALTADADRRAWVASTDGWKRGTRDALIGAAKATLTGNQALVFRERDGAAYGATTPDDAYHLTVYSYANETPNATATLNALLAQKPGGIVLHYHAATMQDYQNVYDTNATYAVVKSTFRDYAALATNQPG
jgi:hypothetical protein